MLLLEFIMKIFRLNIFKVLIAAFVCFFVFSSTSEAKNHKKQWGNISIELKKTKFIGKNVQLEFVFENLSVKKMLLFRLYFNLKLDQEMEIEN